MKYLPTCDFVPSKRATYLPYELSRCWKRGQMLSNEHTTHFIAVEWKKRSSTLDILTKGDYG